MRLRLAAVWFVLLTLGVVSCARHRAGPVNRPVGGFQGKVVYESGGVLPGVTVSLTGPAIPAGRTTVTDGEGLYRFAALPAGTFDVAFELAGFATIKRSIRLDTGFVATVNESMGVGGRR